MVTGPSSRAANGIPRIIGQRWSRFSRCRPYCVPMGIEMRFEQGQSHPVFKCDQCQEPITNMDANCLWSLSEADQSLVEGPHFVHKKCDQLYVKQREDAFRSQDLEWFFDHLRAGVSTKETRDASLAIE